VFEPAVPRVSWLDLFPPAITGVLLFLWMLPVHITNWDKFPVWYRVAFLGTLVPLFLAGAKLGLRR